MKTCPFYTLYFESTEIHFKIVLETNLFSCPCLSFFNQTHFYLHCFCLFYLGTVTKHYFNVISTIILWKTYWHRAIAKVEFRKWLRVVSLFMPIWQKSCLFKDKTSYVGESMSTETIPFVRLIMCGCGYVSSGWTLILLYLGDWKLSWLD